MKNKQKLYAIYRKNLRAYGIDKAECEALKAMPDDDPDLYLEYSYFQSNNREQEKILPTIYKRVILDNLETFEAVGEREIIINNVIRDAEVGLVVGAAKAGKTWIGLDLALSIVEGSFFLGALECSPSNVLYLDAESTREMLADRMRICRINRPQHQGKLSFLCNRGNTPSTLGQATEILRQSISQSDARLCIIDTLTAFFPMENENDNAEATAIMSQIVNIAEDYGCAIMIIHHTPKQSGTQRTVVDAAAGAGAFARRADTVLAVRQEEKENYVDLRTRSFKPIDRFVITFGANMKPQAESCDPNPPEIEKKTKKAKYLPV